MTDFSSRIRGSSSLAVQVHRQKAGIPQPSSRLWDSQVEAGPDEGPDEKTEAQCRGCELAHREDTETKPKQAHKGFGTSNRLLGL